MKDLFASLEYKDVFEIREGILWRVQQKPECR